MIKKSFFPFFVFLFNIEASTSASKYIDFNANAGQRVYTFFFNKVVKNEPIIADERAQVDLAIFSSHDSVSLINFLKGNMGKTETIILAAMLSAPMYNIKTIQERQKKIKYMREIISKNIKTDIDTFFFKNIKSESSFISFLFSDSDSVREGDIVNILNLVKKFSRLLLQMYERLADDNTFLSVFEEDIVEIKRFYNVLTRGNNPFIEIIKEIMNGQFSNKRFSFRLNKKKKLIKALISFRKVLRELWFEFCLLHFYFKLARNTQTLSFTRFLSRTIQPYPYVEIKNMRNFYSDEEVDKSFCFRAKDNADLFQVFLRQREFKNKETLKNMLINIYVSQTFGLSFCDELIMTPFNSIVTNVDKINT